MVVLRTREETQNNHFKYLGTYPLPKKIFLQQVELLIRLRLRNIYKRYIRDSTRTRTEGVLNKVRTNDKPRCGCRYQTTETVKTEVEKEVRGSDYRLPLFFTYTNDTFYRCLLTKVSRLSQFLHSGVCVCKSY